MFASSQTPGRWEEALVSLEYSPAMRALVERFAKTEAADKVGCSTSHDSLTLSLATTWSDQSCPRVTVEYFPQAKRFRLTLQNCFGIPRDTVYGEADEALARLIFISNRLCYWDDVSP